MKYVEHIIMANDGTYLKFKNPNFVRLEEARGCFAERPMEAHTFRSKGTAKSYADKINNYVFPLWGYKKSDLKDKFPLVAVKVELNVALPCEFVQDSIERLTIEKTKLAEEYEEKINKINDMLNKL